MRWKDDLGESKIRLEERYQPHYRDFHEYEGLQRYRQNSKTQNNVLGYKTDIETVYKSVSRSGAKRESCCTSDVEQNDIRFVEIGLMVVEIQCHKNGSTA